MKDDTRKDNFLSTLAEQPEYEKEKGNLEWIKAQFLNIMRGSDWLGSQFSAMINIAFGHEKPQVYAARLMQACSVANIDITENCKTNYIIRKLIQHWANGLPDPVQNQISPALKDMLGTTGGTVKDYIALVHRHVVSEQNRIVVPRYPCGWCSEELRVTCSCSTAKRLKMTQETQQQRQIHHQRDPYQQRDTRPPKRPEAPQGRDFERTTRVRLSDK
jgi:hypothetical protein